MENKVQYLESIRSHTSYPTYRKVIGIITLLAYALAALQGLFAIIGGIATMANAGFLAGLGVLLFGALGAAIAFFMAKFFKEGSLILADIGDSVVDSNAKG